MQITTTTGEIVLVDPEDHKELAQYKWYLLNGYPARLFGKKIIYMHREVNRTPIGCETDHINRDKLDNRKFNLRTASSSTNMYNQRKRPNKQGARGVSKHMGRWRAIIGFGAEQIYLGHYATRKEAEAARRAAEKILY